MKKAKVLQNIKLEKELKTEPKEVDLNSILKGLGIELMEIDITGLILKTIKDSEFNNFKNGNFVLSYEKGLIEYECCGSWHEGTPDIHRIQFKHKLTYNDGVQSIKTRCYYDYDKIEKAISEHFAQ
jgi:hypothetical protein